MFHQFTVILNTIYVAEQMNIIGDKNISGKINYRKIEKWFLFYTLLLLKESFEALSSSNHHHSSLTAMQKVNWFIMPNVLRKMTHFH